jgi:hypothetical protein
VAKFPGEGLRFVKEEAETMLTLCGGEGSKDFSEEFLGSSDCHTSCIEHVA